ncbi:hypothetical protein BGZ90_000039 [Linnemannia elongata]|nr:hypothetical protein BGZ90_000039 [Linnemannia elongata]
MTSSSITSSSSSSSTVSIAGAIGEDLVVDEKRGRFDDDNDDNLEVSRGNNTISDHDIDVNTMDEKAVAVAERGISPTSLQRNQSTSTAPPVVKKAVERSKETREEEEKRWQVLEERFLREDYDSSEYSYASSSDEEGEELPLDYDGPYYSSEESDSSDDEDEDGRFGSDHDGRDGSRTRHRGHTGSGRGSTPRWGNHAARAVVDSVENGGSEVNNVNENKNPQLCIDTFH